MSRRTFLHIARTAVIAQIWIVVTGGVVRLSQSGLGCPSWPRCSGAALLPGTDNPHPGLNQAIEYTNRTFATIVLAVGALCVLAAYRSGADRHTKQLAWAQPLGVVAQIILGGITVLVDLNPVAVGAHFMLSMLIIALTWALYVRVRGTEPEALPDVPDYVRWLRTALLGVVFVLLVIGTIVTGAGPHAGDEKSPRYHLTISSITQLHADFVWITFGLTVALLGILATGGKSPRGVRAARDLLVVELAQGVIGYVQYALGVPAVLVGFHIAGACLVWLATLRVATTVSFARQSSRDAIAATSLSTAPSA